MTHSLVSGNMVDAQRRRDYLRLAATKRGPTAHNLISHNTRDRATCSTAGSRWPGTAPKAAAGGKPQPKIAGIYGNTIIDNVANGNGTKGEGGGHPAGRRRARARPSTTT